MMDQSHLDHLSKLEALQAERPEGRVFTHLAEAYRVAGEIERARTTVLAGLERHEDYPSAHVVHGRVLADAGRDAEAEAAFRRVLELDRHNLAALRALGDLARRHGRNDQALAYYRELLELDADEEVDLLVAELEAAGATMPGTSFDAVGLDADEFGATVDPSDGPDADGSDPAGTSVDAAGGGERDPFSGFGELDLDVPDGAADAAGAAESDAPLLDGFEATELSSADAMADVDAEAYRGIGADESVVIGDGTDGAEATDATTEADEPRDLAAIGGGEAIDGADDREDAPDIDPVGSPDAPPDGGLATATMAELYARQGLYDRAAEIYRELLARRPDDERLGAKLAEVEARARAATDETAPAAKSPPDPSGGPGHDADVAPGDVPSSAPSAGAEPPAGAGDATAADAGDEPDWSAIEALAEELTGGAAPSDPPGAAAEDAGPDPADRRSVEAAWTAGAGAAGGEVTPYAWAGEQGGGSPAVDGPTLREYFRALLDWSEPEAPSTGPVEAAGGAGPLDRDDPDEPTASREPRDAFDRLFEEARTEPDAGAGDVDLDAPAPDEPAADASRETDIGGTAPIDLDPETVVEDPRHGAPESRERGPDAAAGSPSDGGEDAADAAGDGDDDGDDDDDDLEAFRSWLESLKR